MKILTIIGARPQFIKASGLSRAIIRHPGIKEKIVHTGQHFDDNMSKIFFEQLEIPRPDYHLGVGGLDHGAMTGRMLEGIEVILREEKPDWVVVYGDTNTTLAGALASAKADRPIAHIEAGLRSFNPEMPEEINRVLTDRVSTLLLCPTEAAVRNLKNEGYPYLAPNKKRTIQYIENVGDIMFDVALHNMSRVIEQISLDDYRVEQKGYAICTLHRQENTNSPTRLNTLLETLCEIGRELPVLIPMHPRTRARLEAQGGIHNLNNITILDPVPYLEMQRLLIGASVIITDSGGIQKEAFFYQVPCITLRDETEWMETVELGWNQLVGDNRERLLQAWMDAKIPEGKRDKLFGDGETAERIIKAMNLGLIGQ